MYGTFEISLEIAKLTKLVYFALYVMREIKVRQLRQFDDFQGNFAYAIGAGGVYIWG
jgi:hypothetical protein